MLTCLQLETNGLLSDVLSALQHVGNCYSDTQSGRATVVASTFQASSNQSACFVLSSKHEFSKSQSNCLPRAALFCLLSRRLERALCKPGPDNTGCCYISSFYPEQLGCPFQCVQMSDAVTVMKWSAVVLSCDILSNTAAPAPDCGSIKHLHILGYRDCCNVSKLFYLVGRGSLF